MSELIERLRQHWLDQGIAVGNGVSESQVKELEAKYQIILPNDFREYLLLISWPENYEMDDSLISFWTIGRIKNLKEEYPIFQNPEAESYFIFADFLISSHEYVIQLKPHKTSTTPIFVFYYVEPDYPLVRIATSFTEFLERYLLNDSDLLIPDADIK